MTLGLHPWTQPGHRPTQLCPPPGLCILSLSFPPSPTGQASPTLPGRALPPQLGQGPLAVPCCGLCPPLLPGPSPWEPPWSPPPSPFEPHPTPLPGDPGASASKRVHAEAPTSGPAHVPAQISALRPDSSSCPSTSPEVLQDPHLAGLKPGTAAPCGPAPAQRCPLPIQLWAKASSPTYLIFQSFVGGRGPQR